MKLIKKIRNSSKINVLMCCSNLSVKGGMVSVVKNYLEYKNWDNINIIYVPTHIEKSALMKILYFAKAYVKILLLCISGRIDIAHLHTAERGSFFRKAIIVKTCRKFKIKTIIHHHSAEFELFYKGLSNKKKKYVDRILELTDINIVLSQRLVPMITNKAPNARVEVIYNAVNTYDVNLYNSDAQNVLFLGRLGARKGIYDLLEVIKKLDCEIAPEVKFYLCGDGDIDGVKDKVKELSIQNRIAHIGWIDGKQKKEFFVNSCINVLPSYNEGLPMSILETMAYGIPNISTNIASIPEVIIDGENGYLIKSGDSKMLADKIKKLLSNKSQRLKMSKNSYKLIKDKFSLEYHVDTLKKMFLEMK